METRSLDRTIFFALAPAFVLSAMLFFSQAATSATSATSATPATSTEAAH